MTLPDLPQYSFKAHWTDDKRIGVVACLTKPDGGVHLLQTIIDPPPEQRPWVGLTEEELQFYRKKYSKLFNAGYDKVTDTNLIAEEFDSAGFYKEVEAVLKERNT